MMLDFGEAVRRFYGNYANAEGRAQRSAYWWVVLYQFIIYTVLFIVLFMADGSEQILDVINEVLAGNSDADFEDDFQLGAGGLLSVFLMVIFALVNWYWFNFRPRPYNLVYFPGNTRSKSIWSRSIRA